MSSVPIDISTRVSYITFKILRASLLEPLIFFSCLQHWYPAPKPLRERYTYDYGYRFTRTQISKILRSPVGCCTHASINICMTRDLHVFSPFNSGRTKILVCRIFHENSYASIAPLYLLKLYLHIPFRNYLILMTEIYHSIACRVQIPCATLLEDLGGKIYK